MSAADTFHHVRDFPYFAIPSGDADHPYLIKLGEIPYVPSPTKIWHWLQGDPNFPDLSSTLGLQLTKFMVLQIIAMIAAFLVFRGLSRRVVSGEPVRGRWWNFWEMLALFIRDEVVRPTIGAGHHGHDDDGHANEDNATTGGHPADKYLPFIWSIFFYILFCNLLGAIPLLGAATGEINVTAALALIAFGATIYYGSRELGFGKFWAALLPPGLPVFVRPMIWLIELMGLFIKHGVLSVRLFANIMAGHTVVFVILTFIQAAFASSYLLYCAVAPASVLGQVAIGMLELFVAFLQAYIFAFLSTLFIGTAVHPH